MKVAIISYGKFHCFELARELLSKNLQVKVYRSYTQFMSQDYGLTGKNYASFFLIQILDRISQRKFSYFFKSLFAYLILKFFFILICFSGKSFI